MTPPEVRRSGWAALAVCAGVLSCRSPATEPASWRVSARLTNSSPGDSESLARVEGAVSCSGIVGANNWVLTARHCLSPDLIANPQGINVSFGGTRSMPAQTVSVAEVETAPRGLDLALLRLSSPLIINGLPYGFLRRLYNGAAADFLLSSPVLFCTGWDAPGSQAPTDEPTTAPLAFTAVTPPLLRFLPSGPVDQHITAGNAGGPCLTDRNNDNANPALVLGMLAGIGGDGSTIAIDLTQMTVRTWIEATLIGRAPDIPANTAVPVGAATPTPEDQEIDLFWVDSAGAMQESVLSPAGNGVSLAPTADSFQPLRPAAIYVDGELHLFGVIPGGTLVEQTSLAPGTWTPVPNMPAATSGIGTASWGPGRLDIVARTMTGSVMHGVFEGGSWTQSELVGVPGGISDHDVLATTWGVGEVQLFAVIGNHINDKWTFDTAPGDWSPSLYDWSMDDLNGQVTSACAAVTARHNTMDLFARGLNGHLVHKAFLGPWTNGLIDLGIEVPGEPTAILTADGAHIFAPNPDGSIWHAHLPR